jgi:hypothetical protein
MAQIAAGKGRSPERFMLARRKARPDAIWHSNKPARAAQKGKTAEKAVLKRS